MKKGGKKKMEKEHKTVEKKPAEKTKAQLIQLYAQKGELLTELEILQGQLQNVNQMIGVARNAMLQGVPRDIPKEGKE